MEHYEHQNPYATPPEEPTGAYARAPFALKPLRLRGVFGVAWQIYRRGFFGMLLLTLLLSILPALIVQLPLVTMLDTFETAMEHTRDADVFRLVGEIFGSIALILPISGLSTFLFAPMYLGTAYPEYARRMRGGKSSAGALLKQCGQGLKRYYTTYLALMVVRMAVQFVLFFLIWFVAIFGVIGLVASSVVGGGEPSLGAIIGFVLLILVVALVSLIAELFLSFTYPAAVNEGVLHFKAVFRSAKLVKKRFWRVFGVNCLVYLIVILLSLPTALPSILVPADYADPAMLIATTALSLLVALIMGPYLMAISSALYYDAAAREEKPPFDPETPVPIDAPPAPPQPKQEIDPFTGKPIPPPRFDARTGKPLHPPEPERRFDPNTGEPITAAPSPAPEPPAEPPLLPPIEPREGE